MIPSSGARNDDVHAPVTKTVTSKRMNIENSPRKEDGRLAEIVDELAKSPKPVDNSTLGLSPDDVKSVMAGVSNAELEQLILEGDCQEIERYFWNAARSGAFDRAMLSVSDRWWSKYHDAFLT